MLAGLEPILVTERPDVVVVIGDTNSTLAGSLAAAKLGIGVAHVEAGLRSFDRGMPEEINRVVADHLARWLFAPTPTAVANLAAEGIREGVVLVGDLMRDVAATTIPSIRDASVLDDILRGPTFPTTGGLTLRPGGYIYATVHRQENREADAIREWTALLAHVAIPERPVVLSLHPGTREALDRIGLQLADHVVVVEPLGYRTSLALQLHAAAVLTDSGGVQREAAWLGTPCLVLRETTEWIEAVEGSQGRMLLVGRNADRAADALDRLAPIGRSAELAHERAARVRLDTSGAAEAIARTLVD